MTVLTTMTFNNETLDVVSFDRPSIEILGEPVIEDEYGGTYETIGFKAGKSKWKPVVVSFSNNEETSKIITKQLQKQIYNSQNNSLEYKFETIIISSPNNQDPLEKWRFKGCIITDVNYTNSNIFITLLYDIAEIYEYQS